MEFAWECPIAQLTPNLSRLYHSFLSYDQLLTPLSEESKESYVLRYDIQSRHPGINVLSLLLDQNRADLVLFYLQKLHPPQAPLVLADGDVKKLEYLLNKNNDSARSLFQALSDHLPPDDTFLAKFSHVRPDRGSP
jgi:hypothetical protein